MLQSGTIAALIILPLSLGEYSPNWKEAQDICVQLANHAAEQVGANAGLGLAYIARTKHRLEKNIVKPVLLNLLENCKEYKMACDRCYPRYQHFHGFAYWERAIKRYISNDEKS